MASPGRRGSWSNEAIVFITVDEPKSEGFGPTKHTTYRCSSRGSSGATASVRHRFSNFVQLRDTLLELLPGVVVPPLPEKQVMNRFAAEFVEKRRDMLETFLQQIVDHPLAATNEKVHTFLEWTESLRKPVLERCSGFQLPSLPPLEAGDPLKDAGKMLDEFAKQLQSIRETFKRLQARQNEDGLDLHELSQGIKLLSNNPMNSVLAIALNPFSEGLQSLAKHTKAQAVGTKAGLLAKLKLHRMLALAIIEQFKGREKISKDIDGLNVKIKELLNQSTKLSGKPGKEKQVSDLEQKATDLQQRQQLMRDKHALLTQTLVWEHERYNKRKNRDLLHSLQEYALNATDFTSQQHELWGGLSASVMQSVHKVTTEAASLGEAVADMAMPGAPAAAAPSPRPSTSAAHVSGSAAAPAPPPPADAPGAPIAAPPPSNWAAQPAEVPPITEPSPFAASAPPVNPFAAPSNMFDDNFSPTPPMSSSPPPATAGMGGGSLAAMWGAAALPSE